MPGPPPAASAGGSPLSQPPVFIGGTGRSGARIVGRLLGCHSRWADVPIEARFHCDERGMPDLLEGRIKLATFLEELRGPWWHRVGVDGVPEGLDNLVTGAEFDAVAERFAHAYLADPVRACRELFDSLLGTVALEEGKPELVETSSHNIEQAQTLRRLFPDARFVHVVRDGRDSALSMNGRALRADRLVAGIDSWAERLRAIDSGVRGEEDGAPYWVPAERLTTVVLDELVAGDRERAYQGLLSFLDVGDEPEMRMTFECEMRPGIAGHGGWAAGLGRLGRRRVRRRYERALAALEREDNHAARPLIEAYEHLG
jgi:Sulfotransferase family